MTVLGRIDVRPVTRDPFPVGDPPSVQRWMEGEPAEAARAENEDAWLDRILGTTP